MTNFEKIKNMTVEEMARRNIKPELEINHNWNPSCTISSIGRICYKTSDSEEFYDENEALQHEIEWLESEVEE